MKDRYSEESMIGRSVDRKISAAVAVVLYSYAVSFTHSVAHSQRVCLDTRNKSKDQSETGSNGRMGRNSAV